MTQELPPSLVRFGVELHQAAQRELSPRTSLLTRRRRSIGAVALSSLGIVAATIAITGVFGATAGTAPAYALTQNADGTITVTLENLTTGIAQLNARFAQMGINETVIPVDPGCTTPGLVADPGASMSDTLTFQPTSVGSKSNLAYFLAAEQLPDGSIALSEGATKPPLPSCFSPRVLTVPSGS